MKEMLGTLYFTSYVDSEGKLRSKSEGQVIAFVVRRPDGSEFEVRKGHQVFSGTGQPLKKADLPSVKEGEKLAFLSDSVARHVVQKVYASEGDVWIRNEQTGKQGLVKYHELKRVGG